MDKQQQIENLRAQAAALEAAPDAAAPVDDAKADAEIAALQAQIEGLKARKAAAAPAVESKSGFLVFVGERFHGAGTAEDAQKIAVSWARSGHTPAVVPCSFYSVKV